MDGLQKDKTVLWIADRLSTSEKADEILVMEDGKVIERGQHDALMSEDGAYASLYSIQFSESN